MIALKAFLKKNGIPYNLFARHIGMKEAAFYYYLNKSSKLKREVKVKFINGMKSYYTPKKTRPKPAKLKKTVQVIDKEKLEQAVKIAECKTKTIFTKTLYFCSFVLTTSLKRRKEMNDE